MSSRCWQEWDGLDSDLTTPRQIIILASNLPLQTRVLHRGNFTLHNLFIHFKERRRSSFLLCSLYCDVETSFELGKISLFFTVGLCFLIYPLYNIPASAPGTGHWSWLPVSPDSRPLIGQLVPSLASDWSARLTGQLSWLPKIPTSTKTLTLFSFQTVSGHCRWTNRKQTRNQKIFRFRTP